MGALLPAGLGVAALILGAGRIGADLLAAAFPALAAKRGPAVRVPEAAAASVTQAPRLARPAAQV
jgi:hypothetical protein